MPEISIKAEEIFRWGGFIVTNSVVLAILSAVLLIVLAFLLSRRLTLVPGKLQSVFELFTEEILRLMENVFGDRASAEKYFPLIATVFLFILFSNWLGLFPGVGSVGFYSMHSGREVFVPLFRSPASDLNFTVALAIVSVVAVNFLAILALGLRAHAGKFFNFKNPIFSFVGILEFISEFVKIVSFSFRLFGNVFAGEVLLTIVAFLAPYFLPLPFLFLEIFVGLVQAFIFSILTMVFLAMSVAPHESHDPAH